MADFEENVEEMVGTTTEAAGGKSSGDETGDRTAAMAGDERDGGDRWGTVYGRRGVRI